MPMRSAIVALRILFMRNECVIRFRVISIDGFNLSDLLIVLHGVSPQDFAIVALEFIPA